MFIKRKKRLSLEDILQNPLAIRFVSNEQISQQFADFLATCPDKFFRQKLSNLLTKDPIKKIINGFSNTLEEFGTRPNYNVTNNKNRILILSESLLIHHKDLLNKFINLRSKFENHLIIGEYDESNRILSEIQDSFGDSIWLIRNKVLLQGLEGRFSDMQKYTEECKKRTKFGLLNFVFSYIFLISHSKQAHLHLNQLVIRNIDEFNIAGFSNYASLLALLFVPVPLLGRYNQTNAFPLIQTFGVIDQYCLLLNWLPLAINEQYFENSELNTFLRNVSASINCNKICAMTMSIDCIKNNHKAVDELVLMYERGEYNQLLSEQAKLVEQNIDPFIHINLFAKAYAITGKRPDPSVQNPLSDLTNCLANIYSLSTPQTQIIEDAISIAIRLNGLSCGQNIQLAIYKALPNMLASEDAKAIARHVITTTSEITPLTHIIAAGNCVFFDGSYSETDINLIPNHRAAKKRIRELIVKNSPRSEIESQLEEFSKLTPLKKDVFELESKFYLSIGDIEQALNVAALALSKSSNYYPALPLSDLVNAIEEQTISSLDALIVIYYYVQLSSRKHEYLLNETYEEYLYNQDVTRPSELLRNKSNLSEKEAVFFRDISTPDVMDFLGCFESASALLDERLTIIYQLIDIKAISKEAASREVDDIVERIVIDISVGQFNSHKIYVNDSTIKRSKSADIESLFDLYRFATDQEEKTYLLFEEAQTDDGITKTLIAGDKGNTLLKMVNMLITGFLLDPKYGLDQNLSTEIRHGFFSNLMRSRPEARKLLCELDSSGNYKSNSYWLNANSIFTDEIQIGVDEALKDFSADFDKTIELASEWMKITINANEKTTLRVFDFSVYQSDFESARALADTSEDYVQFMNGYIELLWRKTDLHLNTIRGKINTELREKLDKLFDDLLNKINEAKGLAALHELTSAVIQTKSNIREDITTVCDWFKRAEAKESVALPIRNIIGISVRCFEIIKGTKLHINEALGGAFDNVCIDGASVKPLVIALINIFDNEFRHSGFGNNTKVIITGELLPAGCSVSLKNNVSVEKSHSLTNEFIDENRARMRSPQSISLMRKEGGTGLCKIYNNLKQASQHFDVDISYDEPYFITRISYDEENTTC